MKRRCRLRLRGQPLGWLLLSLIPPVAASAAEARTWQFSLAEDNLSPGAIAVRADQAYDDTVGYGYEFGSPAEGGPFIFSVALPEGNYEVTVQLAGDRDPSPVTIKAESRRLMIESFTPPAGDIGTVSFAVHLRTSQLHDGGAIDLNEREIGAWHWDERLQLEFNGTRPRVTLLEISPAPDTRTIFIAGDSTVTDQTREPWIGWGQMLPRFFRSSVSIANYAESGLALRSFRAQGRLEKVFEQMRPGDYLFIQFGHNDMKESGEGIGPWESYSDDLRRFVIETREHGGIPVLITSMQRRRFDDKGRQPATLGNYPLAVRRVAAELDVPLIDLNLMSGVIYAALGPDGSKAAFVHYPANTFTNQSEPLRDDTHFNAYGGYQLAQAVVEGIRLAIPKLARHLRADVPPYDPARPDPVEDFALPASPYSSVTTPAGS